MPSRRVLFLPPVAWLAEWRRPADDTAPSSAGFIAAFRARGIEPEVIDPLGFPWNPLARKHPLFRGLDPLRSLFVLLFRRGVDAVVPVFEGPALLLALLRRLCLFRPRLLMWDIGLTDDWRIRMSMQRLLIDRVDGIMVLDRGHGVAIDGTWPHHAAVHPIGYSVDTAFYRPIQPVEGPVNILAVGDDAGRDYSTLLDAVAGMGTEVRIRSSQVLALDPAVHGRVRLLAERVPYVELRRLYAVASVVVVPLLDRAHAGGVTALVEAAAMGRPIVLSASRGVAAYCRHEETCLVVPPGDAVALRAAIERLLGDPALAARLAANARAFAETECSPEAIAGNIAALIPARAAKGKS